MTDCDFCGGPKTNGMSIKHGKHGWMIEPNPNPADPETKAACRQCAREKL